MKTWGFTIVEWSTDSEGKVVGVILECDNGERQFLTMEEYVKFTNARDDRERCSKKV